MRICNSLAISLLAVALLGATTLRIHTPLRALDVPLSQLDTRFGNMVAEVPCTVPFTFVNGTVADATQVNANFTALLSCLSTIYASDIIPTTPAQATFGGSILYSFPAGVAVAGTSTNPFTDTAGDLWVSQSGANSKAYAVNISWATCGSAGSVQLNNGVATKAFFDCQGNYNSGGGSIISNSILAGNGNFVSPASTAVTICPGGCGSGPNYVLNTTNSVGALFPGVLTANNVINSTPASPIPVVTSAPVGACYYKASEGPCGASFHFQVSNAADTPSITIHPACLTATQCSISVGGTVGVTFNSQYYSCSVSNNSTGLITWAFNQSALQFQIEAYNGTAGTIADLTSVPVGYFCGGV